MPGLDPPLRGFGLSYDDIQRAKAGDFEYVREKVRRRGKQLVIWGWMAALLYMGVIGAVAWFNDARGLPSLWEGVLIMGFLGGPPWIAKKQRERVDEILAP